jgi:hypothetical protein
VDQILAELAAGRFGPTAWTTFLGRSLVRSVAQARKRPLAVTEVSVLHLLAGAAGSRRWALVSWCWAPITLFAATTAAIAAAYFARGRTIDYPRLMAVRYASGATQLMLALRAMRSVAR